MHRKDAILLIGLGALLGAIALRYYAIMADFGGGGNLPIPLRLMDPLFMTVQHHHQLAEATNLHVAIAIEGALTPIGLAGLAGILLSLLVKREGQNAVQAHGAHGGAD